MLTTHDVVRILNLHLPKLTSDDRHLSFECEGDEVYVKCLYHGDEATISVRQAESCQVFTISCVEYSPEFRISVVNPLHLPYFCALVLDRLGVVSGHTGGLDFDPLLSYSG